jgi:hypothetical protein
VEQWRHGATARAVLRQIPAGASLAASTPLVPQLAERPVLVRFPRSIEYLDRQGRRQRVEWIAADLAWMRRYAPAFRRERGELEDSREVFGQLRGEYGVRAFADGVVLLQRNADDDHRARAALERLLSELPPQKRR